MHYKHKDRATNRLVCQIHCNARPSEAFCLIHATDWGRHRSADSGNCMSTNDATPTSRLKIHVYDFLHYLLARQLLSVHARYTTPSCMCIVFSPKHNSTFFFFSHSLTSAFKHKEKKTTRLEASKNNFTFNMLHWQSTLELGKWKAVPMHLNAVKSRQCWQ